VAERLLLDTNAILILFAEADGRVRPLPDVLGAAAAGTLFVSPINAWEIGQLANLPTGQAFGFDRAPALWFDELCYRARLRQAALTANAAILSSRLPGDFHKDPADRLLVATAIEQGASFVTRDRRILDWANATGAVKTLAC
jgi:PIN domain nuclease of toxin-antitoxin system